MGVGIVSAMQRFEALHTQLRQVPQQIVRPIASRAQQLHEEFIVLQKRSLQLTGNDGRGTMLEEDAAPYAAQLEAFAAAQAAFVHEAEEQVRHVVASGTHVVGSIGPGATATSSMPVAFDTVPPSVEASSFIGGSFPSRSGSTTFGSSALPSSTIGGQVTPATDRRLSTTIKKVVDVMQAFEGIKPRLEQLPPRVLEHIAQRGQHLQDRFVTLQRRGVAIAGDAMRPMLEANAAAYAADMEAFFEDQTQFVGEATEALKLKSAGGLTANALGSGLSFGATELPSLVGTKGPSFGGGIVSGSTGGAVPFGDSPNPTYANHVQPGGLGRGLR